MAVINGTPRFLLPPVEPASVGRKQDRRGTHSPSVLVYPCLIFDETNIRILPVMADSSMHVHVRTWPQSLQFVPAVRSENG